MFKFQLNTYGVLRSLLTPRMSQGELPQSTVVLNIGPVPLKSSAVVLVAFATMVPPGIKVVAPVAEFCAPVGITFSPAVDALLTPFWPMKMERCGIS